MIAIVMMMMKKKKEPRRVRMRGETDPMASFQGR